MAPNTAAPDPLPAGAYPQIVLLDGLEQSLVKEQPQVRFATDRVPMKAKVPLRSVVDHGTTIEYRFIFRDVNEDDTTTNPIRRTMTFPPRTRRFVEATAISLKAVSWELEIRRKY